VVNSEAGLNLGSTLLTDLGTPDTDISLLRKGIHEALAVRTAAALPSKRDSANVDVTVSRDALHSMSSMDSATGCEDSSSQHALTSDVQGHDGSSSGGQERKQTKKKKESVEMFVLDGRYKYGMLMRAASRPVSTEPAVPCNDCPLVRDSLLQQSAAVAATTAPVLNGSSGAGPENGQVLANGTAAAVAPSSPPNGSGHV
jgi:hypothetical protein